MLRSLHIRNLALVVELDMAFGPGLNAVTGETGAGKSLILGAVHLLLGGRAAPGLIRAGAPQAEAAGVFLLGDPAEGLLGRVSALLESGGLPPCEDGELLVRRVLSESGSRAFVNGSSVTAGFLRELGSLLVDIHGPHEHQSLLQPRCQLDLLDAFAGTESAAAECEVLWRNREAAAQRLAAAREETLNPEEMELFRHQLREIDDAAIEPGEEAGLGDRHRVLANARSLMETADRCRAGLAESDGCITDLLGRFVRLIRDIEDTDPERGAVFMAAIEGIVENVQELASDLGSYAESFDPDPEALQRLEDRLALLQKLKRRYGPTAEDVLATAERIRARLDAFVGRERLMGELAEEIRELARRHGNACKDLHAARERVAGDLGRAISDKLGRLGFERGRFSVEVAPCEPGPRGSSRVEFCFAPNPGEPMMPLRRIASSGEMARVMLAVKTVLTAADSIPVLIFDEVDANIGGRVASAVAAELAAIGSRHQVFSITHLPQIAAAAGSHYRVSKRVEGDRTVTTMDLLDGPGREGELVRMLGAGEDSGSALNHARDMLARAGDAP